MAYFAIYLIKIRIFMNIPSQRLATAGLVLLRNKMLLLAFSSRKKAFYLPGGKLDVGESPVEALVREVKEELGISISENNLRYYCHITAPAYGEPTGCVMEQDCYILDAPIEPVAMAEIEELKFFSPESYAAEAVQVPGVLHLFEQLKKDGLL